MNIAYDNAAIENHIYEALTGDAQRLALDFAVYLQAHNVTLERGQAIGRTSVIGW